MKTALAGALDAMLRAELGLGEAEAITLAVERGEARLSTASRNFVPIWPRIYPAGLRCSSVTWFTMRPRRALPGGRLRAHLGTNLRGAVLGCRIEI